MYNYLQIYNEYWIYNIQNSLAIIEAARFLKMSEAKIAKGLSTFRSIQNRWQIESVFGANLINDAYNANPEAMVATIKNFLTLYKGRKILVLGDMGELGKDEVLFHKEIGHKLKTMIFAGIKSFLIKAIINNYSI